MADHSPERDRQAEPGGLSEATGSDGQDGNPLAQAFRKLREGRGREAANLYHDIVKPRQTPVMAHIERGVRGGAATGGNTEGRLAAVAFP